MTHRALRSLTASILLTAACSGEGVVFDDEGDPCVVDAEGNCTEADPGIGGSGGAGDGGGSGGEGVVGEGGFGGAGGFGGGGGVEDLCVGDDESGDTDADGICDDQDVCVGADASGDADGVCNDLDLCHGDDATGDSDSSGTCDGAIAAMAVNWSEALSPSTIEGGAFPIASDVDNDGDLDVVTRHHNQRRLVQWTNATGALAQGPVLDTATKPLGHAATDLDGDDADLVAGGALGGNLLVFLENLGVDYGARKNISVGTHISNLIVMPVDADARPDIVAFDKIAQQLVLHLNGTDVAGIGFGAASVIDDVTSNAFDGPGLAAVDADGDGDLDLVVSTGQLNLYINQGGSFAAPVSIDAVNLGSRIHTADLDRDGDEDFVGIQAGNAVWYENLGDGTFGAQQEVAAGSFDKALAVGDIDGDGDTDVVLRDNNTGELIWVENGNNGLVARASLGTAAGTFAVGDVDGDGDGDVVTIQSAGLVTLSNPLF